eukprot:5757516-Ditylum_brightwellii.AAC.1
MISSCACPGCPGKKKHKTTSAKTCVWHNKLRNVTNKDVPQAIKQLVQGFLPANVYDVTEVLLEKLHKREGLMTTDEAAQLLENERNHISSMTANENENNQIMQKSVMEAGNGTM